VKLLLTGDWHLRFKKPKLRNDDYFESQSNKIKQILEIAKKEKCDYIIQPGDFFDSMHVPLFVIQYYIKLFKEYDIPILCVRGQHDLRYHSDNVGNTPIAVMEASEVLTTIPNCGMLIGTKDNIVIYGCSFNEEIPKIISGNVNEGFNILVVHKMIVEEKIWQSQEDFIYGNHMFRKFNFDLFACGDNHNGFILDNGNGRFLVNCGSLMRSTIDQANHEPFICVYTPGEKAISKKILTVKNDVFDVKAAEEYKKRNEEFELFADVLKEKKVRGLNFLDNIKKSLDDEVDDDVRSIVFEALNYTKDKEQ